MSNIGYRTTRLFEQAFAMPSMTGHGFADSLQTLTAVRKSLHKGDGLLSRETAVSLELSIAPFLHYFKDRLLGENKIPPLSALILAAATRG